MIQKLTIGFPHPPASGGPGSFQIRLTKELRQRGFKILFPCDQEIPDLILVVGGTAKLKWLWDCKRKGTTIIQRLDGINWQHRVRPTSLRHYCLSEIRNFLIASIRKYLADHVIYQSQFVQEWWHQKQGPVSVGKSIIYNGVDLSEFKIAAQKSASEPPILLCVEGNVPDDPVTLNVLKTISERLAKDHCVRETLVCGGVSPQAQKQLAGTPGLKLLGKIPRERMREVLAEDAVFLVLEINPPCPNSVIEALAAGIPVVGFDTGSLRELVSPEAGKIVPPKSDPWKLEKPDIDALEKAIRELLPQREKYGLAARSTAEARFDFQKVTDSYLEVFGKVR